MSVYPLVLLLSKGWPTMNATAELRIMNDIYTQHRNRIAAEWQRLSLNEVAAQFVALGVNRETDAIHELACRAMRLDLAQPETNTEAVQQADMFTSRVDDLPLFSNTAPRGRIETFDPPTSSRQAKLF